MPGSVIAEVVMVADAPPSRAALAGTSPTAATSVESATVAAAPAAGRGDPALAAAPEPRDGAGLLLSAGVGAHIGAPHPYAALTLLARVGARLGHWEVQGYGQWDVTHVALAHDPADIRVWAVDAGIAAGRRDPAGFLTFTYGIQIGASWSRWENRGAPPSGNITLTDSTIIHRIEPRVGVAAGVLVPIGLATRLRPSLTFDLAPLDLGVTYDEIGAPVSWSSVALALSVEFEP